MTLRDVVTFRAEGGEHHGRQDRQDDWQLRRQAACLERMLASSRAEEPIRVVSRLLRLAIETHLMREREELTGEPAAPSWHPWLAESGSASTPIE